MAFMTYNKFGNEKMVVAIQPKKNKDFPYGYAELGGRLYKLTVTRAKKDGVDYWLTIEKAKKVDNKGF